MAIPGSLSECAAFRRKSLAGEVQQRAFVTVTDTPISRCQILGTGLQMACWAICGKMDGQQTNGWTRSSTAVVLEAYGAGDRVTFLIDELVRLIIFQRRDPFPAAPRGPQLAYAPVADAVEDVGKKRKGKKGGKKTKTKNGEQRQAPLIDKYYVAGRIHDIWLQFQADYAHLTKCKPGQEAVFFKHLVAAMNKTSLLSTVVADLQRLLKVFKKRFAKDGFPFPPSYLEEGRPVDHFPGKGASQEGANSDDSSALARSSHKIPDPGL
jgi:hypothetical protein